MTAVIAFPVRDKEIHASNKQFGPAQVIIFTGVRHERLIDVGATENMLTARKSRLPSRQNQAIAEELD
jgi:hypothetical protein